MFPLLPLLLLHFPLLGIVLARGHPRLVQTVRLANVSLSREVHFWENSSLVEDVQLLDRLFEEEQEEKEGQRQIKQIKQEEEGHNREETGNEAGPRARLLIVGDHSLFDKFLRLYGLDEYAAYNGLSLYLEGVFLQLQSIFGRLPFFQRFPLRLELAGPPMDCPLRSPLLSALQQGLLPPPPNWNVSSSALPVPSNASLQPEPGVEDRIHWDRLDALLAVQWTSRWIRQSQEQALLPAHEHLLLVTAMDLLSQLNESSTQGMAYVRAMCRDADSVSISVVEDVGALSTPTVAAHEMAHSLGAFHDGSGESENCSVRHNFLMAPISAAHPFDPLLGDTFGNAFLLSACSQSQIQDFLNSSDSNCLWEQSKPTFSDLPASGPSRGEAKKAGWEMLEEEKENGEEGQAEEGGAGGHSGEEQGRTTSRWRRPRPGEQFSPGRQCQLAFGPSFGLCQRRDFHQQLSPDPCRRLWCKDRRQRRWAPCETKGFLPMMDGTSCGEGKWCERGQCRRRGGMDRRAAEQGGEGSEGPTAQSDCVDLNGPFCLNFGRVQLHSFCPVSSFSRICCQSCRPFLGPAKSGRKEGGEEWKEGDG